MGMGGKTTVLHNPLSREIVSRGGLGKYVQMGRPVSRRREEYFSLRSALSERQLSESCNGTPFSRWNFRGKKSIG